MEEDDDGDFNTIPLTLIYLIFILLTFMLKARNVVKDNQLIILIMAILRPHGLN
jgi:uncharacterized membrane protein YgaE (UPF0421/DUF939 family)